MSYCIESQKVFMEGVQINVPSAVSFAEMPLRQNREKSQNKLHVWYLNQDWNKNWLNWQLKTAKGWIVGIGSVWWEELINYI